jgi:hypothetical protein
MSEAPYWAPASRQHYDGRPTAAEQVWQRRYGHPELRGDEHLQVVAAPEIAPAEQPTVPEALGAEAIANA